MKPVISLHLPKTAGTSFVGMLKEHYKEDILLDYDDLPISVPLLERTTNAIQKSLEISDGGLDGKSCVHGHFLPIKYLLLSAHEKLHFITWLRHPFDRAISHYNYWQKTYNPETSLPHQKEVIEERWSLEDFCLSDKYRNIYTQYLWGFPLENFDFIGITEYFDDDFIWFTKNWFSIEVKPERLNTTGIPIDVDPDLKIAFESFHKKDMNLYNRALEMRLQRL